MGAAIIAEVLCIVGLGCQGQGRSIRPCLLKCVGLRDECFAPRGIMPHHTLVSPRAACERACSTISSPTISLQAASRRRGGSGRALPGRGADYRCVLQAACSRRWWPGVPRRRCRHHRAGGCLRWRGSHRPWPRVLPKQESSLLLPHVILASAGIQVHRYLDGQGTIPENPGLWPYPQ